ncbi:hypothetical protein PFISCL1PPCAC_6670, partial [Pristionchus fissidentatus]
ETAEKSSKLSLDKINLQKQIADLTKRLEGLEKKASAAVREEKEKTRKALIDIEALMMEIDGLKKEVAKSDATLMRRSAEME